MILISLNNAIQVLSAIATGALGVKAWYQVQATGTVKQSGADADITTVAPEGSVSVELPLKVTVNASHGSLELAHYYAAGALAAGAWRKGTPSSYSVQDAANTAGLYTAFHLNNSEKTLIHNNAAIGGENYLWTDVTITITKPDSNYVVDGTTYTPTEIASLLNGKTIDVAIARDTGSRAMFWGLGSSAVSAPTAAGATEISSIYGQPGNAVATLSNLDTTGTVLHFGLYVEGDNSGTVDTALAAPQGDFVVTVTQNDPNAH